MGNDHSVAQNGGIQVKRRESTCTMGGPPICGDETNGHFEPPRRRRMSSCVIGTVQHQQQGSQENMRFSESPQSAGAPTRPLSPRQNAFRSNRPLSQQQFAGSAPQRELPQTPYPSRTNGGLSPQPRSNTSRNNLLSPCQRHRRMSVAGDHQEALRRELARADGNVPPVNPGTGSGGQTPQRRFSRATANGGSRKLSSIRGCGDDMMGGTECTVAEQLKLTSYQMQILQQSWPKIRSHGTLSGVFRELAQTNNAAKEMFQKMSIVEGFSSGKCCDQKEHVRQLTELIDFALQNLNSPSKLVQQKCHLLGEQHFSVFGSANESKIWDDFGECISHAIAKAEPVRGKREAFRAWITVITFMVESMRAGYVQQFKRRSLTRHSSNTQLAIVQLATVEEINSPPTNGGQISREKQRSITPTGSMAVPLSALQI